MAPLAPLGKQGLLRLLKTGTVPISFGSPHPHHAVVQQDGVFRLRALEVDQKKAMAASLAARAAGRSWMPEHHYALAEPTGAVFLEAPTLNELIAKIEAWEPWPSDW